MYYTLNLRVFFFNARTDYLPYYKHFTLRIAGARPLRDLLELISREHHDFDWPKERCWVRLEGKVAPGSATIDELVERLGRSWQIDPLLTYRALHALRIDDRDFDEAFEIIAPWADASDRAYYESLYPLHYASEGFRFSTEYIGDAVLLTAHRMIARGHEAEEEILRALSDHPCGLACAEYENNLFDPRDETATFEELRRRVFRPVKPSFAWKLTAKLSRKTPPSFEGYGIKGGTYAIYTGPGGDADRERFARSLAAKGGTAVSFERSDRLIGRSVIESAPEFALLKAGTMLADAFDRGAQALVFSREVDLRYIREHFGAIERIMKREIPLPLISYAEFSERFLTEDGEGIPAAS